MQTKLTREDAIALLRKYNKEPFHILHGLTVGGVLKDAARSGSAPPDTESTSGSTRSRSTRWKKSSSRQMS